MPTPFWNGSPFALIVCRYPEMRSSIDIPLDSRQLRAFTTLASTGSFTRAAKELFLSQSAVSHSMKALERDVGCRLFDRLGKKVVLTQTGEQLLKHAEKILDEMSQARASLKHLQEWGRPRLRLGASATACQYLLPPVLNELQREHPSGMLSIEPVDAENAVESMDNNSFDLAFTLRPHRQENVTFIPLFTDEMCFLIGPSHPWAQDRHVDRAAVARQNYVLYNKSSYTCNLIESYFRQEEIVLNTVIHLGSMDAIKQLVKLGMGISILAPWIARDEQADGSLIQLPLGRRKLKREWGISFRRGRRLNMLEETFIVLCRKQVQRGEIPSTTPTAAAERN